MTFLLVGGGGAALRAAIAVVGNQPQAQRRGGLQGLPDAQPHRVRRRRRRRRYRRRRHASTSTPTTPSRAATGWATRTASRSSSTRSPRSCCAWSIGAARGAASPTASVAVRPFGGMKKMRTWFAADKTGFHMLHTLFQTSLQLPAHPLRRDLRHQAYWSTTAAYAGRGRDRTARPARSARSRPRR